MTEDFLRLVSQANPAARPRHQQYQPANGGNGHPDRSDALMDPFFDDHDDEDNVPDSAFGPIPVTTGPNRSQESQLPLSRNAAPTAGGGTVLTSAPQSQGLPQGWNFDDEDFISVNSQTFPGSSDYPPPPTKKPQSKSLVSRLKSQKWKWPWEKDQTLTGDRIVALNNSAPNVDFCSNHVSTSKYNLATFLPKFLFGKLLNLVLTILG
jgi:phospholipid-transporting ATPase